MKKSFILATGLFALTAAGPLTAGSGRPAGPVLQQQQAAPVQQQNVPQGNAANGRKLFASFGCYQCHGYEAQGGSAGARRGAPAGWDPPRQE
jgi:mono/diheme cytochrome c family protein